ncbi:VOC family protein [Chitinophaga horti]|uniref:VOC family protein n=1 Tax=Chitinophaga horti TaxID=2920382 RepID=A0ABY6J8E9_9BACT|nr:VOC family protein [Chitinophaga horti]UYQ94559.1 VOC family protein [Chitinophaga horti]
MLKLNKVHHIAIICSDYERSKAFYTDVLGFQVIKETYRLERQSYKLDLSLNGQYLIELFTFPSPPPRPSRPEAQGLRHLAFEVDDVDAEAQKLRQHHVPVEDVRVDEITKKKFTFFTDPDGLPLEIYEK